MNAYFIENNTRFPGNRVSAWRPFLGLPQILKGYKNFNYFVTNYFVIVISCVRTTGLYLNLLKDSG